MGIEREKQVAAEAAAELVEDGMTVGLGTGSTVAFLLPALATPIARHSLCRYVAAHRACRPRSGPGGGGPQDIEHFDIAIDGADQIAPDGWLVKGGGAAHTREKIVAAAADRFVVIADSSKLVDALHGPIPLELLRFGLRATMRRIAPASLRDVPLSPDGGVIADYQGPVTTRQRWPPGWPPHPVLSSTAYSRPRWWQPSWWAGARSVDRIDFTHRAR